MLLISPLSVKKAVQIGIGGKNSLKSLGFFGMNAFFLFIVHRLMEEMLVLASDRNLVPKPHCCTHCKCDSSCTCIPCLQKSFNATICTSNSPRSLNQDKKAFSGALLPVNLFISCMAGLLQRGPFWVKSLVGQHPDTQPGCKELQFKYAAVSPRGR